MPVIRVYEQIKKGVRLATGRVTVRRVVTSFAPIEDWEEERGDEDDVERVRWYARGGEKAIHVKLPIDAQFEPLNGSVIGRVVWPRSPLTCQQIKQITAFGPDDVLKIARRQLRAENGDTFTIVEADNGKHRDAAPTVSGEQRQGMGGGDLLLAGREAGGVRADLPGLSTSTGCQETTPHRCEETTTEPDGAAQVVGDGSQEIAVTPGDGVDSEGAGRPRVPSAIRIPFPDLAIEVVAPIGARIAGGTEAPTLVLSCISIAFVCLPDLAKLGRYGLKTAPIIPMPAPFIPETLAPHHERPAIYSETVPTARPGRRKPVSSGQLSLF